MLQRIHEAGATLARINVSWAQIAPGVRPAGFVPANPADPGYNWAAIDAQVRSAVGHGLTPYFTVWDAPLWAQKDEPHETLIGPYRIASWKPDPAQFGAFARALALRYDGTFSGLPRVPYFEVCGRAESQPVSEPADRARIRGRRRYLSRAAERLCRVGARRPRGQRGGRGSLSGFSFLTPYGRLGIAPLVFLRKLLCMSAGRVARPTCKTKVDLDAVSIHPWTIR